LTRHGGTSNIGVRGETTASATKYSKNRFSPTREIFMKRSGLTAAVLICATMALAQSASEKPGPELKKLDVLTGSWTLDCDLKPGPMRPGGKITESEKCEWMDGGFYVVCHSDCKGAMGNGVGLSVLGYSNDDKLYTYHEFNSWGEYGDSKGTIDGDKWTWGSDEKMGNMSMKSRFTMNLTSATSYTFSFEMSPDGTKWNTVMDGKATKTK
jgi:Protein of unknown function (DUF1579)